MGGPKPALVPSLVNRFNHACFATFGAQPFDPRAKGAATDADPGNATFPEGEGRGVSCCASVGNDYEGSLDSFGAVAGRVVSRRDPFFCASRIVSMVPPQPYTSSAPTPPPPPNPPT